tara:strand:- start:1029 stop:1463 length:435 start_codon:yes stop_codon:yes gene_type:complete
MDLINLLGITGAITVATLFGSMAFFSCVVAPLVFIELDAATAGRFIRRLFPWYYAVIATLSLIATLSFAATLPVDAITMGLVFIGACVSRQILMPRINRQSDAVAQGDISVQGSFDRLHRISVIINAAQMIAVFCILFRSLSQQ